MNNNTMLNTSRQHDIFRPGRFINGQKKHRRGELFVFVNSVVETIMVTGPCRKTGY